MDNDIETALRALNNEFRVIKNSLEPLSAEFKKINSIEIELKKLKLDIVPKIKKLEMDIRRFGEARHSKEIPKMSMQYKNLEGQLNKIKSELILSKKEPRKEKENKETESISDRQKILESKLKKTNRDLEQKLEKLTDEFIILKKQPGIDKEQQELLNTLSQNQSMIKSKLDKSGKQFEDKYYKQIQSNRKMIVSLISENNQLKHEFEKKDAEFEKLKNEFQLLNKGVLERDKDITKSMNTRRRHINQIVEEINQTRKKSYSQGIVIAENKEKIDDMKIQLTKLKNSTDNLENSNKTKVDMKYIEDVKLDFSRLEKKTNSDVGEIKARMRELERKLVGKKDIDKMQTTIQDIQTNQINKLKIEFAELTKEMSEIPKKVEAKLSNLKRVMQYIDNLKSDSDKLSARADNAEAKFIEINKLKSGLEMLDKKIGRIAVPVNDMQNLVNYVDVVKKDYEKLKDSQAVTEQRIDKLSKTTVDMSLLKSVKEDVVKAMSKSEKLESVVDVLEKLNEKIVKLEGKFAADVKNIEKQVDGLNIKVEKTSKMLGELDKVL